MSIYNEDELKAPSWLTEVFMQTVLREDEKNEDLQVIGLEVTPASMKGDHYGSTMFRIAVEYRHAHNTGPKVKRNLILKTLPEEEGPKRALLMNSKLFETEIAMYTQTLPMIEQILSKFGDNTKFMPKCVYSALKPEKVIIFDDLCTQGYYIVRGRYLDMDELKPAILKLSKLHAVTYMLGKSEDKSALVTKYKDGLFCTEAVFENDMMKGGIKRFITLLENMESLKAYAPKFKKIEGELFKSCLDLYRAHQEGATDEIFVLNHGDFHLKNLMYKFNKKTKYEDVMLVDFQLSIFAPSVIDLIYASFMLLGPEMRREKRNEIIHYYFDNFINTLKKIEYKGELPKFSQYQISTIKHRHFAVYLLSTFLPMIYSLIAVKPEDVKDLDISKAFESTDFLMNFYRHPEFIKELKDLLPILLNAGYLD